MPVISRGESVAIEYRWADNQMERLPLMAAELVRRQSRRDRRDRGSRFGAGGQGGDHDDPYCFRGQRRPGQAWSGCQPRPARRQSNRYQYFPSELVAKRLELLRELVPAVTRVAVLVNPANAVITETTLRDLDAAAHPLGLQIQVFRASTSREINLAFATFVHERPDALFVAGDPFFALGECNLPIWRRITRSLRHMGCVT